MIKQQTFRFGPTCRQQIDEFTGFDTVNSPVVAMPGYAEIVRNVANGQVALIDRMGQFSRESRVTLYNSLEEYETEREAQALKMARLTGRI